MEKQKPSIIEIDQINGVAEVSRYIFPTGAITVIRIPGDSEPIDVGNGFSGYETERVTVPGLAQEIVNNLNN